MEIAPLDNTETLLIKSVKPAPLIASLVKALPLLVHLVFPLDSSNQEFAKIPVIKASILASIKFVSLATLNAQAVPVNFSVSLVIQIITYMTLAVILNV